MSSSHKTLLTILITALVTGAIVFVWQESRKARLDSSVEIVDDGGERPSTSIPASGTGDVSEQEGSSPSVTEPNYINAKYRFSLQIPEGYHMSASGNLFHVVQKPTPNNETPLPELTMRIEASKNIPNMPYDTSVRVLKEALVQVNGIPGTRYEVANANPPSKEACPVYQFLVGDLTYEFRLYECLASPVFETVVQSFRLLPAST